MAVLLFVYVWRVHDLFPVLAAIQLPSIVSLTVYALFVFDRRMPEAARGVLSDWTARSALVLYFLMVLSVPFSLFKGLSFGFVFPEHLKVLLMMVIIAAMASSLEALIAIAMVMLAGATMFALMVFTRFTIGARGELQGLVVYDANDLGMLFCSMIPFSVLMLSKRFSVAKRIVGLATLGAFVLCVVKTGSRGAFLGTSLVWVYMLLFFGGVSVRKRWGITIVGIVLAISVSSQDYWDRIATIFNPSEDYNWSGQAETGRMEVWKRGIGYMMDRPLTGVGVQAFPVAEGTISPLASRQQMGLGLKWSAAHNSFVQIGAELGVAGLLVFLAMLVGTVGRLRRATTTLRGVHGAEPMEALGHALTASLLGYSITGFFLSQAYAIFLYALLGLTIAYLRLARAAAVHPGAPLVPNRRASPRGLTA